MYVLYNIFRAIPRQNNGEIILKTRDGDSVFGMAQNILNSMVA